MSLFLVALLLSTPLIVHVSILYGHVTFPLVFIPTVFILVFVRSWIWRLLSAIMAVLAATSLTALEIPDRTMLLLIKVKDGLGKTHPFQPGNADAVQVGIEGGDIILSIECDNFRGTQIHPGDIIRIIINPEQLRIV